MLRKTTERLLGIFVVALCVSVFATFAPSHLHAQTCLTDTDCQRRLAVGGVVRCVGDVLVRMSQRCVGGRCQQREQSRQNCALPSAKRCTGNGVEVAYGRCNASLRRCDRRVERYSCVKSCSCEGKTLTVSTGKCSPAIGCHLVVSVCQGGCACRPKPVCHDRVQPKL